jgi:hypothetical protein
MAPLVRQESRALRRALIAAAFLLVLPASASATTVKQYKPKAHTACRTHYVKRRKTVKEHKHGKVVKVKQTWCVYVAPKTKTPTPTTAAAPVLAVHLDPSFTQSPTNPLEVTYTYSASATVGGSPDASLPAGVLEFFSDGLLVCSENVGGATNTGTCGVTYSAYGTHTVNTVYDSGTNSATTGTETVDIEAPPPPAPVATTATLSLVSEVYQTGYTGPNNFGYYSDYLATLDATTTDPTTYPDWPTYTVTLTDTTTGASVSTSVGEAGTSLAVYGTIQTADFNALGNTIPTGDVDVEGLGDVANTDIIDISVSTGGTTGYLASPESNSVQIWPADS